MIEFLLGVLIGVVLSAVVRAYIAEWREIEEGAMWE
jgi:Tfp pilus assembly protein PilW